MIKKRIVAGGLIGWAGIVRLAWVMADDRIRLCANRYGPEEPSCLIRTTEARDHVLTSGLTVALIGAVLAALAWSAIGSRNGNQRVIQARSPRADDLMTRLAAVRRSVGWRSRRPHVRLVLAMAFGMCLAAGLLWLGGMIAPVQPAWPGTATSKPNAFADLIPAKPKSDVRLIPVEGDPYADIPVAQSPTTSEAPQGNQTIEADAPVSNEEDD